MKCPTCGRPIHWNSGFPQRPFCSERCRLIDLGAWLSGDHAIAGEQVDESDLPPPPDDSPRERR